MAVIRNKDTSVLDIPKPLKKLLQGGFTMSCLQKIYKKKYDDLRADIQDYLNTNKDGFEIERSKSFQSEHGKVNLKFKKKCEVNTDLITEKLKEGKVTIETILAVAKFSAENLKKLGLHDCFTEVDGTEFIELTASPEFKAQMNSEFEETDPAPAAKPKKAAKKKPAKKAKTKAKSAESDLDSILEDE